MKSYKEYTAEREITEALDDTNKAIVDAVKSYFKDAYNFPTGVRFKTTNNKSPFMTVTTVNDQHSFNAKDLNAMLHVMGNNGESTNLRGNYVKADLNQWAQFIQALKGAENLPD
jgi:hypothetical protein